MKTKISKQRIKRYAWGAGTSAALCFAPSTSFSQQSDSSVEQEAQKLLESAVELMQAKQFAPACRKIELVLQKIPQATGARLELARCYRGEGRMASAWRQYVQVENLARIAGQKARIAEAGKNATELSRIVGKLQIDVSAEVATIPGITISVDGVTQERSSWGMPVPADAMEHEIIATAPGREPWVKRVIVNDNPKSDPESKPVIVSVGIPPIPGTNLRLDVPVEAARIPNVAIQLDGVRVDLSEWADGAPIESGSHEIVVSAPGYETWGKKFVIENGQKVTVAVPRLAKPSPFAPPKQAKSISKSTERSSGSKGRTVGIVGMAAGGLVIGAGAVLGAMALSRNHESDDGHCDANDFCDDTGYALRSEALTFANASTATLIAGGALAATGVVLFIASPPSTSTVAAQKTSGRTDSSSVSVWFGPTNLGFKYSW